MFKGVIKLSGKQNGPTSIILAGVHGTEKCGVEAFEEILPNLEISKGEVYFAYGNPRAINKDARYVEANLNRLFQNDQNLAEKDKASYEYERAQYLKKYLDKADVLLDLHASRTPESEPFAICESNAHGIVERLPVNRVVSGFDDIQPGGTDYYMNQNNKIGICVECGYTDDPKATEVARKSIFAFLKAREQIDDKVKVRDQTYVHIYDRYMTQTDNFTLEKQFKDFEEVSAGQIIGTDGDKKIKAGQGAVILFARNQQAVDQQAFLLGKKKNSLAQ